MQFCNEIKNLDSLEIYHLLENEMSKYKTLHHESIKWDLVHQYSLEIIQKHSFDVKICNYFIISCVALNNEANYKILPAFFAFFTSINLNNAQKNKLKNIIDFFLIESSKLNIERQIAQDLNESFKKIGEILECHFKQIEIAPIKQIESIPKQAESKSQNMANLSDREYRTFFLNLANEILGRDKNNLNAYAMFVEAMWGRILNLPPHSEFITQIRRPDNNLAQILLQDSEDSIARFMENLALNPFWFEGLKLFCEYLNKNGASNAANLICTLAKEFLIKFSQISNLKFSSGESMCGIEIFNYFFKQDLDSKKPNKSKNLNEMLLDIDSKSKNHSLFTHINSLIDMAKTFEEKNMQQNAKILYTHAKELMEKTLLKDYLLEDYLKIKAKSTQI